MSESKKILFTADATIRCIADLHTCLKEALSQFKDVIVNTAAITDVDVSFVQLMESARKTAASAGIDFTLAAPASGPLLDVLQRGGFLEAKENVSFWLCK